MLYLDDLMINKIGIDWNDTENVINTAVGILINNDFAQPVKPYLRYRDMKNRLIAMPAFIGGEIYISGLKWITSFPDNIKKNMSRAHSVIVLNEADTGIPKCIINTPLMSTIRTASVSSFIIKKYCEARNPSNINVGIVGYGPIGQYHLKMVEQLLQNDLNIIYVYDTRSIDKYIVRSNKLMVCNSWEEAYENADIFITCTVADCSYIDKRPKESSLHLNVSLRDYTTSVYTYFKDAIFVDDWEEVCRENTDIYTFHTKCGLQIHDTKNICHIYGNHLRSINSEQPIMFNPMGLAVFDIAIANYYYNIAIDKKLGIYLS